MIEIYKNQNNFIPRIEVKIDNSKKRVYLRCVFLPKIKIGKTQVKSIIQEIYNNFCPALGLTAGNDNGSNGKGFLWINLMVVVKCETGCYDIALSMQYIEKRMTRTYV